MFFIAFMVAYLQVDLKRGVKGGDVGNFENCSVLFILGCGTAETVVASSFRRVSFDFQGSSASNLEVDKPGGGEIMVQTPKIGVPFTT